MKKKKKTNRRDSPRQKKKGKERCFPIEKHFLWFSSRRNKGPALKIVR
jgi:hypothetical protein